MLGFAVTVVDVRDGVPDGRSLSRRDARAPRISASSPSAVPLRAGSFVLVMNHHLERDQESLRFALDSDAAYIGVLGPRSRYQTSCSPAWPPRATSRPRRACRACEARLASRSARRHPKKWRCPSLAKSLAIRRGFEGGFLEPARVRQPSPSASDSEAASFGARS